MQAIRKEDGKAALHAANLEDLLLEPADPISSCSFITPAANRETETARPTPASKATRARRPAGTAVVCLRSFGKPGDARSAFLWQRLFEDAVDPGCNASCAGGLRCRKEKT